MMLPALNRSLLAGALAAALLPLCSCENTQHRFAAAFPSPGTVVNWPGVSYAQVRAFCYDYTQETSPSFFVNGRMHKGVMDPKGVTLNAMQTRRLMKLITTSQPKGPRTPCYAPHHAYVFYDAKGKVVAWFEMCFGCNQQRSHPGGTPEYVDRAGLWQLTAELGLPVGSGNKFYSKACSLGAPHR